MHVKTYASTHECRKQTFDGGTPYVKLLMISISPWPTLHATNLKLNTATTSNEVLTPCNSLCVDGGREGEKVRREGGSEGGIMHRK